MIKLLLILTLMMPVASFAEVILRISEDEAKRSAIARVDPSYPIVAKQMKIMGRVQIDVLVNTNGSVEKVNILSGNALLTPAAVDAGKKWKFSPFLAEHKPVKAICTLTWDFKL